MHRLKFLSLALVSAGLLLGTAGQVSAYVPESATAPATEAPFTMDSLVMVLSGVNHHKQGLQRKSEAEYMIAKVNSNLGLNLKLDRISRSGLYVIASPYPLSVDKYVGAANYLYGTFAEVKVLQPNFLYQPLQASGRVPAEANWNLRARGSTNAGSINAVGAWPLATGRYLTPPGGAFAGADRVNIAILDNGVRAHPQLAQNFMSRWAPPDGIDWGYPYGAVGYLTAGADFTTADPISGRDPRDSEDVAVHGFDGADALPEDRGDWTAPMAGCRGSTSYGPSSWHGTHVAGTAAAQWSNGNRWSGVAPDARITPVRVLAKCGGDTAAIVDGIRWAAGLLDEIDSEPVGGINQRDGRANPAHVINMSLGMNAARALNASGAAGRISVRGCRLTGSASTGAAMIGDRLLAEQMAINDATSNGTVVVVAAGNDGTDVAQSAPAACENVITVGAVRPDGQRAFYSNFDGTPSNQIIDVMAPGGEMRPTYATGSAEPAELPEGIYNWIWNGFMWEPQIGYLHPEARYCVNRAGQWYDGMWNSWQVRRETLSDGQSRWMCVNTALGWRSPVFISHANEMLSSVNSFGLVTGDTFGVFQSQRGALDYLQGTSMAAPHVAGVVALMLSVRPNLTPGRIEELLRNSATPMSHTQCRASQARFPITYQAGNGNPLSTSPFPAASAGSACGAGMVNAAAAVWAAVWAP